jgi:hypothetical protein
MRNYSTGGYTGAINNIQWETGSAAYMGKIDYMSYPTTYNTLSAKDKLDILERKIDGLEKKSSGTPSSTGDGRSTGVVEEVRTTSSTGGQKGVKSARYDLIPTGALRQLAEHYGRGAEKYDDNQWRKGYEWSKSYAALQRHATEFWSGEDFDEETGSNHLAAVAWHALTLLTFYDEHPDFDDRFTS